MRKLFSLLLVVCVLAITFGVFAVSTMAETEVVVWEGDINQEITTSNTLGIITSANALNFAIREDLAKNGVATKYVLTSSDSRYIDGDSGYVTWGFFDESTELEIWSDGNSTLQEAFWTETRFLSMMGQDVSICFYSDSSDTAYAGHVKLVATHSAAPSETGDPTGTGTTPLPEPTGDAADVVSKGVKVWSGSFNQDFTTASHCMAVLDNKELSDAIYSDVLANGFVSEYAVVADMQYISGESGYATFCFCQEDPTYLEIWPEYIHLGAATSAVFKEADQFEKIGSGIQLAICSDAQGVVVHLNGLAVYAIHSGKFPTTATTGTENTDLPEPTGEAAEIVNKGVKVWSGVFNKDYTTDSYCMAPLECEALSEAIYNDVLTNGVATSYALVANARYVSGESGYATFCIYQDTEGYFEIWPDGRPTLTSVVWTDDSMFDMIGRNTQLALCCDTKGDVIHLNSLALYATHSGTPPTTGTESTELPEPTGEAAEIVNKGVEVWSGVFNKDYTTNSYFMAPLECEALSEAIYNDVLTNGVATAYALVANARYVSGESDYATFCIYQDTEDYFEIWPNGRPGLTSVVWTDDSMFDMIGRNTQLALCCDTKGDVIHLNSLALYALHDGEPTVTNADPSVAESSKTEPTEPTVVSGGDANNDGVVNMKDVLMLRKYLADMADDIDLDASDVNGDGVVNMKDVLMLRKYLAGLIDTLGA